MSTPVPSHFESDLLRDWLSDIHKTPHFQSNSMGQMDQLETHSKALLSNITEALSTTSVPDFSSVEFEPIFKLWHHLLSQQSQSGVSIRDTAMLLLSLKSSVNRWLNSRFKDTTPPEILPKLNNILDILGVLTFEVYTHEQERLIQRQDAHIHYLQTTASPSTNPIRSVIGNSPSMLAVSRAIELITNTDVTVLLEGETGTGKDVIASVIHKQSNRASNPFITLNCGAIPRELIETELFGHEKGSFTGAEKTHIGKFEMANEGTIFLDEIGELPLDLQVKLLRVLQNQEIQRVGGDTVISINVRVIAATNRSLKTEVSHRRFREDLFYRLNVYPITIPPLRERTSDILSLAAQFLSNASERFKLPIGGLSDDAKQFLTSYSWPGNVRELENLMQRAVILAQGDVITSTILSLQPGQIPTTATLALTARTNDSNTDIMTLDHIEAHAIKRTLKLKSGNVLQAAKALGISRTTLYAKAKKHGITL